MIPPQPPGPPAGPGSVTTPDVPPGPDPGVGPTHGLDSLTTFDLDCVDPEVGTPQTLTTGPPEEEDAPLMALDRVPGLLVQRDDGERGLSFGGAAALSAGVEPQAGSTCSDIADANFYAGLKGPQSFPAINFPSQECDSLSDCWQVRESWARAHYYTWAARAVLHYIASKNSEEQRRFLWSRPGLAANGSSAGQRSSPEYWFGPWSDKRFDTVKRAIDKLWDVLLSNKTGGITVKLRCPEPGLHPANVCFSKKPAAHHWVKGTVDLCASFFTNSDAEQGRLMAHELLHHLFVKYGAIWVAVQDTHYHGHGLGCGLQPKTEAGYGEEKIRELATYENSNGDDCGHRARNVRNNDTYAQFVRALGHRVYSGELVEWPLPTPPTAQPPACVGEENCLCTDESTWPANQYFEPDGDFSPDLWCPDNDGEMTCMETKFGATPEGVCKKCDVFRGPGCECDDQRPCATGSCFGDTTFGGGVGHCFEDPPPSWACLADCNRLFNSNAAWCYAEYPTGQARCMDHLCSQPQAYECASEGKVCRYGQCVVECDETADCQAKGYPDYFECQSHRCEYAFALE